MIVACYPLFKYQILFKFISTSGGKECEKAITTTKKHAETKNSITQQ